MGMAEAGKPSSAWEDISNALKVTAAALTVVSLGIPGLVAKLASEGDDVVEVGRVLALTAPLSLWVGLTILLAVRSQIPGHVQFMLSVATLTVLTLLGNAIGVDTGVSLGAVWDQAHGSWQQFFGLTITKYALHYGAEVFVSALVVGGFLGYAWCRLLRPAPRPHAAAARAR